MLLLILLDAFELRPGVRYNVFNVSTIDLKYKKEIQTSCILYIGNYQTRVMLEVFVCLDKGTGRKSKQGASQFETLRLETSAKHWKYWGICSVAGVSPGSLLYLPVLRRPWGCAQSGSILSPSTCILSL